MYITFDHKMGVDGIVNVKHYKTLDEACKNFTPFLGDIKDWVIVIGHFCCNSENYDAVHYIVDTSFIPDENDDSYDASEQRRALEMIKLEVRKIKLNEI